MTRLAGKTAQAVQIRNDHMYAMRRLVSDKQVKKIDSIQSPEWRKFVIAGATCAWTKRLDSTSTFSHNFWALDVLFSFRKPTRSTFSIRVSNNRFSTGVLLNTLFVWQVDHTQAYQRLFCICFLFLQIRHFVQLAWKRITAWHTNRYSWSARHSTAAISGITLARPGPRLLSPTTVPEETKEIPIDQVDSFTSHSLFIILRRVFFFNRSQRAGSAWPVLFPEAWAGKAKRKRQVRMQCWYVVRPPHSWSWPRGRIIVVTPSTPLGHDHAPVVRPRLRIVAVKGHDFLLKFCLLPSYVNAWSHGCRSWSQCERKILTGKYNDD